MIVLWNWDNDFPGRYLFMLLPLLGAAISLRWSVERVERSD